MDPGLGRVRKKRCEQKGLGSSLPSPPLGDSLACGPGPCGPCWEDLTGRLCPGEKGRSFSAAQHQPDSWLGWRREVREGRERHVLPGLFWPLSCRTAAQVRA